MASKPETTFSESINRHVPLTVYRMKTHNPYIGGIPDFYYSGGVADLWVEYKYIPKATPKQCKLPDLSALQLQWINGRLKEGRNVAVIVGCPAGGVVYLNKEWEVPLTLAQFQSRVQSRKVVAEWIAGFTQGGP